MPVSKKQSKSRFKWPSLRSRKAKLITTILVFAIVGGGILIYKSFAATGTFVYTWGNGTLGTSTGASKVVETLGKTNYVDLVMPKNSKATVNSAQTGQIFIDRNQNFSFCVIEKGANLSSSSINLSSNELQVEVNADLTTNKEIYIVDSYLNFVTPESNGYTEWCNAATKGNNAKVGDIFGPFTLTYTGSSTMTVQSFEIKLVDPSAVLVSQPTK